MDFAGWAKRVAEFQIYAYKLQYDLDNFAVARPSNIYGPCDNFDPVNSMVIPYLISRIFRGDDPLVVWGEGSARRDFLYSRDTAEGIILALYHGTGFDFVNIGSGHDTSIKELVEILNSFIDSNYKFDTSKPSGYRSD